MHRRPVILLVLALTLAIPITAEAGYLGGLGYDPGQWAFSAYASVGFAQRDLHLKRDSDVTDKATSSRFTVKPTVSFLDWLEVYGLIGAADWRLDQWDFKGVLGTQYGGGLRLRVFPWFWEKTGIFNIDLDAQANGLKTSDNHRNANVWEYQFSGIVSKEFQVFIPYGGVKYTLMGANFSPGGSANMAADTFWGVFIGVDYFVTPFVFFSAELHIFTDTAVNLGVGLKY